MTDRVTQEIVQAIAKRYANEEKGEAFRKEEEASEREYNMKRMGNPMTCPDGKVWDDESDYRI